MSKLLDLATYGTAAGKKAGADAAEAYVTRGRKLSVDIFRGEPEVFEKAETGGAGIRAFRGRRMGYAYTTDLTEEGLTAAAKLACANAGSADEDKFNGLPDEAGLPAKTNAVGSDDLGLTSPDFGRATTAEKIKFAREMEEAALRTDSRVKGCETVTYGEEDETVVLANTAGFAGFYRRQASYGFIDTLAEAAGDVQTGFSYCAGHSLYDLDAAAAGQEAAERAVVMLGGQSRKPGTITAVFDPLVFIQVLTAISPALSADAAQKGRSFLADAVGQTAAAECFSLVDDGRLPGGLGSSPFDDEGVPTSTVSLIEKGVLTTLLYNSYAARKAGVAATGNGARASFRTPPGTSPTNLFVKPGGKTRDDIISSVGNGLYVMGLQGLHAGVSPVTGQFSAGAYGLRIKDGRLAEPVREITIASSCPDILKNVVAVGADIRFVPMGAVYGSPTVAVEGIVVSGR